MKHPLLSLTIAIFLALPSCAVLSETQKELVSNLAISGDTITSAPSRILYTLGEIRVERGLYYAATFTSAEVRFEELKALAEAAIEDKKRGGEMDLYISVVNSYFKALKSVANDQRWKDTGREIRSIGRSADSLVIETNKLFNTNVPEGFAKTAGKTFGYLAENVQKYRQAKLLKGFVEVGDSLVSVAVDSLVSILKSPTLNDLIENECQGLNDSYQAYIYSMAQRGYPPQIEYDREYIELVEKGRSLKQIKSKSISALQAVKRAHHKLSIELKKEDEDKKVYDDFKTVNRLAIEIAKLMELLK